MSAAVQKPGRPRIRRLVSLCLALAWIRTSSVVAKAEKIRAAWKTPIWQAVLVQRDEIPGTAQGAAESNLHLTDLAALKDFALFLASSSPGVHQSNVGGWHSTYDLLRHAHPTVRKLVHQLQRVACDYLLPGFDKRNDTLMVALTSLWVNVNGPGHFNRAHVHTVTLLAGKHKSNGTRTGTCARAPQPCAPPPRSPAQYQACSSPVCRNGRPRRHWLFSIRDSKPLHRSSMDGWSMELNSMSCQGPGLPSCFHPG